jgi:hypothetical protein
MDTIPPNYASTTTQQRGSGKPLLEDRNSSFLQQWKKQIVVDVFPCRQGSIEAFIDSGVGYSIPGWVTDALM